MRICNNLVKMYSMMTGQTQPRPDCDSPAHPFRAIRTMRHCAMLRLLSPCIIETSLVVAALSLLGKSRGTKQQALSRHHCYDVTNWARRKKHYPVNEAFQIWSAPGDDHGFGRNCEIVESVLTEEALLALTNESTI
jgi:hypothetical protein